MSSKEAIVPLRAWWIACRQLHAEVVPNLASHLRSADFSFAADRGLFNFITALAPSLCSNITSIYIKDTTQGESVLNHLLRNEKLPHAHRLKQLRGCHICLRRFASAAALQYLKSKTTVQRDRSTIRHEIAVRVSTVERLGKGLASEGVMLVAHDVEGHSMGWRDWLKEQNAFMAKLRTSECATLGEVLAE